MGLSAEIGGRAGGGDWTQQGATGSLGFARFRAQTNHFLGAAQGRDGQGQRVERHLVHAGEVTFIDLLLAAGEVELDELHEAFVLEIGDRRIVEGDVAVLTDAEAAEVDFLRSAATTFLDDTQLLVESVLQPGEEPVTQVLI